MTVGPTYHKLAGGSLRAEPGRNSGQPKLNTQRQCCGRFTKRNVTRARISSNKPQASQTPRLTFALWWTPSLEQCDKLLTRSPFGASGCKTSRYIHPPTEIFSLQQAAPATGSCVWQAGSRSPGNSWSGVRLTNQRGPNARMVQRPPSAGQSESGTAISGRNLCCGLRVFGMRSGIIVPISQLHNSQNHSPLFRQIA